MKQHKKPIEAQKYTKEYFLTDCEGYEIFKTSQGRELSDRLKDFYRKLIFDSEDRVLEIGCGRGEICNKIAPHVRSILGIDYSAAAIELCLESYKDTVSDNLKFYVADAKQLPFPDNSFDLVYCSEILEHLHDWELKEMMNEIVRVLDTEGRFIGATEPNRIYRLSSSVWSFLPRALQSVLKARKIHFMIERPIGHVRFHVNEQTYWSVKRLVRGYFKECKIETYEMILGMNWFARFVFNAYPLNKLPLVKLFFDREIIVFCKRPQKK